MSWILWGAPRDDHHVRPEADQRRLALDGANGVEEPLPPDGIVPPRVDVLRHPAPRTLDRDGVDGRESGLDDLLPQLVGMVEVRRGEVAGVVPGVAMLPAAQVPLDDGDELGI